jgi:hypothetical protein
MVTGNELNLWNFGVPVTVSQTGTSNFSYWNFGIPILEGLTTFDLVPKMTSGTVPAPVVITASVSSSTAFSVFDDTNNTYWSFTWAVGATRKLYIFFGSGEYRIVDGYSIRSRVSYKTAAPYSWDFCGSNDSTEWTILDTRTNESFLSGETRSFIVDNVTQYKYYRLKITAMKTGILTGYISEMQLFGTEWTLPPNYGEADFTIPIISLYQSGTKDCVISLPTLDTSGSGMNCGAFSLPFPILAAGGFWTIPTRFSLPMFQVAATHVQTGNFASFSLPILTLSGTTTAHAYVAFELPLLTTSGFLSQGNVLIGSFELPSLELASAFLSKNMLFGNFTLPKIGMGNALLVTGGLSTGSFKLPLINVYGITPRELISTTSIGIFTLPIFRLTASGLLIPSDDFVVYTMNTRNFALSKYTNFGFNSMCKFGTLYLASSERGIYKLTGLRDETALSVHRARNVNVSTIGTDSAHGLETGDSVTISGMGGTGYNGTFTVASTPDTTHFTYANTGANEGETADTNGTVYNNIQSRVTTGRIKMGVDKLKRLASILFGMKGYGDYYARMKTDSNIEYQYPFNDTGNIIHPVRVKTGKGARGEYWIVGFDNKNGENFELDNIDIETETTTRRT